MSRRVPAVPPVLIERATGGAYTNSARIATPVLGQQWKPIGEAMNWLLGGGTMQLGWFGPRTITAGSTSTFRTYAWPRYENVARLWTFTARSAGAFGAVATEDAPGGKLFSVATGLGGPQTFLITELVSAPNPAGEEISVDLVVSADSPDLAILTAGVTEIPLSRVGARDANGYGIHQNSLKKGFPIQDRFDGAAHDPDRYSVSGVLRTSVSLLTEPSALRRAKIFDWYLESGVTSSSTSYANIFRINPSVQTRNVLGTTTATASVAVYASASTSDGQVRITSSVDASTTTLNITSATPAWYTGTLTLATDDMTETAGWISDGGVRKTLTIEHKAATGNCITYGVSIGEE